MQPSSEREQSHAEAEQCSKWLPRRGMPRLNPQGGAEELCSQVISLNAWIPWVWTAEMAARKAPTLRLCRCSSHFFQRPGLEGADSCRQSPATCRCRMGLEERSSLCQMPLHTARKLAAFLLHRKWTRWLFFLTKVWQFEGFKEIASLLHSKRKELLIYGIIIQRWKKWCVSHLVSIQQCWCWLLCSVNSLYVCSADFTWKFIHPSQ